MLGQVGLGSVRFFYLFFPFLRRTFLTANCPTAKNPRAAGTTSVSHPLATLFHCKNSFASYGTRHYCEISVRSGQFSKLIHQRLMEHVERTTGIDLFIQVSTHWREGDKDIS